MIKFKPNYNLNDDRRASRRAGGQEGRRAGGQEGEAEAEAEGEKEGEAEAEGRVQTGQGEAERPPSARPIFQHVKSTLFGARRHL